MQPYTDAMTEQNSITEQNALNPAITAALARNPARVQRLTHDGQVLWIKRRETLRGLRRLQKGNPSTAFASERSALHRLAERDAPVPPILAEGANFFAIPDSGRPLSTLLTDGPPALPDQMAAFAAAGRALAGLHGMGLSHGRPSLKDICWDGTRITFIDLERYADHRNTPKGHAMDVIMFVFNGLAVGRGMTPEMQTAIAAYRASDSAGIWQLAQRWCRRMRWIDWVTKPAQWQKDGKANEFKAIPLTLATFSAP